jgi:hypothetical protein
LTAEDIISRYKGGQSMAAIATYGRIPVKEVREVLVQAEVPIRNTPREQQARVAQIFAAHGEEIVRRYREGGESGKSLGKVYGVAPSTILGFLDVRGVRRRGRREAMRVMHRQRQAVNP